MAMTVPWAQWFLGFLLVFSSIGVLLARKPVHASLSFLLTLMSLAGLYLQLDAQFIAVMQVLVYAGAILVIFMFVIILFQDAYHKIDLLESQSSRPLLIFSVVSFLFTLGLLGNALRYLTPSQRTVPKDFGMVESLGKALYVDFFFPFEAVILLFLVALIGALYIAKRGD